MAVTTFQTMGTMVSLHTARPTNSELIDRLHACFHDYDALYSLYSPTSQLSRINSGELLLSQALPEVRDMYATAMGWRSETEGDFTPNTPDGAIDLSGIVKAKAMETAGRIIAAFETDWLLNVGGDVLISGSNMGMPWLCGIADPDNPQATIETVPLDKFWPAIATSGTSERGEHVWRNDMESTLRQVSVLADSIVVADVLATALLSGGVERIYETAAHWHARVIAVTKDDRVIDVISEGLI